MRIQTLTMQIVRTKLDSITPNSFKKEPALELNVTSGRSYPLNICEKINPKTELRFWDKSSHTCLEDNSRHLLHQIDFDRV